MPIEKMPHQADLIAKSQLNCGWGVCWRPCSLFFDQCTKVYYKKMLSHAV